MVIFFPKLKACESKDCTYMFLFKSARQWPLPCLPLNELLSLLFFGLPQGSDMNLINYHIYLIIHEVKIIDISISIASEIEE